MGREMKPKPCPFCGAEVRATKDPNWSFVRCEACDCEGPSAGRHDTAEAISAWNRRSEPRGDDRGSGLRPLALAEPNSGATADTSSAAGAWVTVPQEPTEAMVTAGIGEVDLTNPYPDDVANNVWAAMIASAPKAEVEGWRPTHRHVKRGTEYEVLGMGAIQSGNGLLDGDVVVIYRAKDGMLWARDREEFFDGRFQRVDPATRDGADEPHLVEASTEREARSHTDPTPDPLVIVKPRRKG